MKKSVIMAFIAASLIASPVIAGDFKGSIKMGLFEDEDTVIDRVKINIVEAIEIAKKKIDGYVIEAELEKEDGYLVWEIEFLDKNKKEHEIHVDPVTGEVFSQK